MATGCLGLKEFRVKGFGVKVLLVLKDFRVKGF